MTDVDIYQEVVQELVDPESGEIVHRSDVAAVARLHRKISEIERQFREAKRWATDALLEVMDERAEWTLHVGAMKITAPSPDAAAVDWDLDELAKLEGLLPSDRYGELVQQVVTLKPVTKKLQTAAKAGGEIGAIIRRAERRTPRARYVRVS